jgi:hypothetical protein
VNIRANWKVQLEVGQSSLAEMIGLLEVLSDLLDTFEVSTGIVASAVQIQSNSSEFHSCSQQTFDQSSKDTLTIFRYSRRFSFSLQFKVNWCETFERHLLTLTQVRQTSRGQSMYQTIQVSSEKH